MVLTAEKKSFTLDTTAGKLGILMFKLYLQSLESRNSSHFFHFRSENWREKLCGEVKRFLQTLAARNNLKPRPPKAAKRTKDSEILRKFI